MSDPISVEVVQAKIQEFEHRFKALKTSTWECLESHSVDVKEVMTCVADLLADDLPEHKVFTDSALHILFQAEDHIELFGSMNFYWNYVSYHLLEFLANKFSLGEVNAKIEEYKNDLQLFMQETPANLFSETQKKELEPPPGFRKLVVQHEWPESVTMVVVEEFRQQFARQYNLHECALMFVTIQKGSSFTVVWFIPECIAQRLEVKVGEEFISNCNITRLETGGVSVSLKEESRKVITPIHSFSLMHVFVVGSHHAINCYLQFLNRLPPTQLQPVMAHRLNVIFSKSLALYHAFVECNVDACLDVLACSTVRVLHVEVQ